MPTITDIRKLKREELQDQIVKLGEPGYRANQVHEWLWKKRAVSFDEMTNLSKELRESLNKNFSIHPIRESVKQISEDGTIKCGFSLDDGKLIEGVLIPADERMTACISSQVGCTLSCAFCATGQLKREKNLETAEIFDQVVLLNAHSIEHYGRPLTNIVYMGMGEPLLNYNNVVESIRKVTSEDGLGISPKRITVSTVGIVKGIEQLANEGLKVNLALSLHAATDVKRNMIMDINRSNSIERLIEAMRFFYETNRTKITFEYILFKDFNDSPEDALALVKLCRMIPAFVNLIEFNPVEGVPFEKANSKSRMQFVKILDQNGVKAKMRMSRGKDIDAACGQLANKEK